MNLAITLHLRFMECLCNLSVYKILSINKYFKTITKIDQQLYKHLLIEMNNNKNYHQCTNCLYSSFTDILLIVSYPTMMLKLNVADCINLALKPLQNIFKPSSTHKSLKAQRIEPILWTCSLARTTSNGLVKIVVVKPPKVPAMLWMRR